MLLKQCSASGSSQRSTNPLSPLALLGGCYKENVLHSGSLISGFDFFVDLPKPYNFAFSIYCSSCLPGPYASPGSWGEESLALWGWYERSAVEGSVSHALFFSDIILACIQPFLALDVWSFRMGKHLKSYSWMNVYVKVVGCNCICWTVF